MSSVVGVSKLYYNLEYNINNGEIEYDVDNSGSSDDMSYSSDS